MTCPAGPLQHRSGLDGLGDLPSGAFLRYLFVLAKSMVKAI
jgi:hypothetical protein